MEKLKRRQFTAEFKIEAVKLVLEQGYSYAEAGKRLGVLAKLIKAWAKKYRGGGELVAGAPRLRVTPEQQELSRLRQEVQRLRMERDILKNLLRGVPTTCRSRNSGDFILPRTKGAAVGFLVALTP